MSENANIIFESMKNQVANGHSKNGSFNLLELTEICGIQEVDLIEAIKELKRLRKVSVLYSDNKPTIIALSNRMFKFSY